MQAQVYPESRFSLLVSGWRRLVVTFDAHLQLMRARGTQYLVGTAKGPQDSRTWDVYSPAAEKRFS